MMETGKRLTFVSQRRATTASNMSQVLEWLGWDEETYCWYKYETGLQYLKEATGNDRGAIAYLECHTMYWAWWKNHWAERETEYLAIVWLTRPDRRHLTWFAMHDPITLSREATPNGQRMMESYPLMLQNCGV